MNQPSTEWLGGDSSIGKYSREWGFPFDVGGPYQLTHWRSSSSWHSTLVNGGRQLLYSVLSACFYICLPRKYTKEEKENGKKSCCIMDLWYQWRSLFNFILLWHKFLPTMGELWKLQFLIAGVMCISWGGLVVLPVVGEGKLGFYVMVHCSWSSSYHTNSKC